MEKEAEDHDLDPDSEILKLQQQVIDLTMELDTEREGHDQRRVNAVYARFESGSLLVDEAVMEVEETIASLRGKLDKLRVIDVELEIMLRDLK